MTLLQAIRLLVRPRYRVNWIRGRYKTNGFDWYVRGTDFPTTHENWLRSLVTPFEGELFVDVGAHIGTWAIRATKTFRWVVAFEPTLRTSRILRTTVKMNKLRNISVFSATLSNIDGEMKVASKSRASIGALEQRIPVRTLDSFKLKPTLLKIDTEGSEYAVLQGAVETLARRPRLVVETHGPESLQSVRAYLDSQGYSIREIIRRNRFNQIQSWLLCN